MVEPNKYQETAALAKNQAMAMISSHVMLMTNEEQNMMKECFNGMEDELNEMSKDNRVSPNPEDNALDWDYFELAN